MLHFLGPTGAREFLTELARNPDKLSIDVVGYVAKPNRFLFIRDQGNRVKKLPGDETGEEIVIPAGRLAPAAQ
jgi:hypothetical protein